jgi:hypothetical protein
MIRLPVRVISEGVSSLTLAMLKVKALSKVCELASVTLTKTFTFNITDVNDETPSDITSTGNLNIAENTTVNTNYVKSEGFIKGMRIGISYSNRDIKVFGSFIIYSFSKF